MEDSFYQCCKTNQLDKIEQFIPSTDVTLRVSRGFEIACESGSLDVVKFLLEKKLIPGNKAFPYACESGHLDAAKLILATEEVDINILDSYAFRYACSNGHLEVVQFLLSLNDSSFKVPNNELFGNSNNELFESEINVNVLDNFAFVRACKNGHLDIVKLLASIRGKYEIDISGNEYFAFRKACEFGNLDVVKFLLQEYDIDVHLKNEYAFRHACANGHLELAKWLVENYKIDINAVSDYAFRYACVKGNLEIVKFLLSLSTNSLVEENNELVENISFEKIDIRMMDNYAFRWACKEYHADVADYLADLLNQKQYEFYYREKGQYYIVLPLDYETNKGEDKFVMFDDFKVRCRNRKYLKNCLEAYKIHYSKFAYKSARKI